MEEADNISTFSAGLGSRMREVRGRESRADSAKRFDIHANTLAKYEEGKRKPDAELIAAFAEAYGVEPAWLLTGQEPREKRGQPPPDRGLSDIAGAYGTERVAAGSLAAIKLQDVSGRFGSGGEQRTVPFPRAWLTKLALPDERICALVAPDRMNEPDIADGDLVLVDTGTIEVDGAGFYVFAREGALLIRWAEPDLRGGLILKGAPSAKTPLIVDKSEVSSVRVFGRVAWRGGVM